MRSLRLRQLGLFLALLVLTGCGSKKVKVSGQVLIDGKPLPGGLLMFRPDDAKLNSVAAQIDESGNYQAVLPAGGVKVSVDNRELQPPARAVGGGGLQLPADVMKAIGKESKAKEAKKDAPAPSANSGASQEKMQGRYVPIPDKYYTIEESGIAFTIEPGKTKYDIQLSKK